MILKVFTFTINEFVVPMLESYILISLLLTLGLEKRFKYKYFNTILAFEILLCILVVYRFDHSRSMFDLLLMSILMLLVVHVNLRGSVYKKVIGFGLFVFILFLSETIVFILMTLIGINPSVIYISDLYYLYVSIISVAIKYLLLRLFISKAVKQKFGIKRDYLLQIILLVIFTIIACFSIAEMFFIDAADNKYIEVDIAIIRLLATIIIQLIVIFISIKLIKQTRNQVLQQQVIEQYKIEYKFAQKLNLVLDNLRILKHDLKNHISCMWGLVETDNIEDFKLYLTQLTKELEEINDNNMDIVK